MLGENMKEKEFISLLSFAFGCSENNHHLPKEWNKIVGENFFLQWRIQKIIALYLRNRELINLN